MMSSEALHLAERIVMMPSFSEADRYLVGAM